MHSGEVLPPNIPTHDTTLHSNVVMYEELEMMKVAPYTIPCRAPLGVETARVSRGTASRAS